MSWRTYLDRKRPIDAQLDSELRFHLDQVISEKVAAGASYEAARREAILEFGGSEQVKEELRDVYRIATIENTISNLKSGLRLLRKSPSFSVAVILTLALALAPTARCSLPSMPFCCALCRFRMGMN